MPSRADSLTDVAGLRVGHHTDLDALTGCTVVLCEAGAVAAVDVRGGAPATRETDLLRPGMLVQVVHGILLAGGSAFGLAAADGVVTYLEERGIGFATGAGAVPIVPAAALFDLSVGDSAIRPTAHQAYLACQSATDEPVAMGSVGAGTGATVGHLRGAAGRMKGGLGSASRTVAGATVGALVVVNAFGDIIRPYGDQVVAGTRAAGAIARFLDVNGQLDALAERTPRVGEQTTLGVVATDAELTRDDLVRVLAMAHDGLARAIRPAHTAFDGDIIFGLSTWQRPAMSATLVGTLAAELAAEAVLRAVLAARGLGGVPAAGEL